MADHLLAAAEKNASFPVAAGGSASSAADQTPDSAPKLRSCVVCRSRKVRCDKKAPCSNCRRANIRCVRPSADRPPRWARRLDHLARDVADPASSSDVDVEQAMARVRTLEALVKELTGQLEHARAAGSTASSAASPSSSQDQRGTSPAISVGNAQHGRLVAQNAGHTRYVGSRFWSRVIDELDGLNMNVSTQVDDSESSEDLSGNTPSTQEIDRTPSERNAFLFRHTLPGESTSLQDFHPLPSQLPFILDVFLENVNTVIHVLHIPTISKIIRDLRGRNFSQLKPANEALLFSVYYSAVTSMEDDEVMANFGASKSELNLKYRVGLERALAKTDFLNVPDIVVVQAFAIFLFLARRHDSPTYVWMLTGLTIRMARALGLQRDGSRFEHLTPFEVETRRRLWWALCMLDVRASEDQGSDLTIAPGSFDTRLPLNINEDDIAPGSKQVLMERTGSTDIAISLFSFEMCDLTRRLMALSDHERDEQEHLLNEISEKWERSFFGSSEKSESLLHWVGTTVARLVVAKMRLLIYLPVLFSEPNLSKDNRDKLFVSAIEVAEFNHALNAERECRRWRWAYQTYTHWHAIIFLLIEITRRSWSPLVERAWVALHSRWLIPARSTGSQSVWVPIRRLMNRARRHRDAEIERLRRGDNSANAMDYGMPLPRSLGPFPEGTDVMGIYQKRWRQLVSISSQPEAIPEHFEMSISSPKTNPDLTSGRTTQNPSSTMSHQTQDGNLHAFNVHPVVNETFGNYQVTDDSSHAMLQPPFSDMDQLSPDFMAWLSADTDLYGDALNPQAEQLDMNMDLDGEMDWNNWVESAKHLDWETGLSGLPQ